MKNEFDKMVDRVFKARYKLPNQIAVVAVDFSKERFRKQNWLEDQIAENWQPRKKPRQGSAKRSQTLLVNTGRLKRSIRKISATQNMIVVGTDVPYAQIHNDGGKINTIASVKSFTKKAHTRIRKGRKENVQGHRVESHHRKINLTMAKRKFIGNSAELDRRVLQLINQKLEMALKG